MIGPGLARLARTAASSLWRHRLRSLLTVLGIVFGVGSVVAMLAVGKGESEEAQARFGRLGVRNLIVRSVRPPDPVGATSDRTRALEYGLDAQDLEAVRATVPGVVRVVGRRDVARELWSGERRLAGWFVGVEPGYEAVTDLVVARGRWLTSHEPGAACVVGAGVASALFPGRDAVGGFVRVGPDYHRVVGVLAPRGAARTGAVDDDVAVFVPLAAARERVGSTIVTAGGGQVAREVVDLHQAIVEVDRPGSVPAAAAVLRRLVATRHARGDAAVTVPLELLEEAARTKRNSAIVLGAIAAISLLVGGIGIMNITLASATERTREIGIRRALGARRVDIVRQFLAETVLLATTGGALGCLLGVALPALITRFFGIRTEVAPGFLALALGVSATVGVVFGLYPASRASRLDPVEALRHA